MRDLNRSKSIRALAITAALVIGASSCGGADTDIATAATSPDLGSATPTAAPATQTPASTPTARADATAPPTTQPTTAPTPAPEEPTADSADEPTAEPVDLRPAIQSLDPTEAIANAEGNIDNLAAAETAGSVFDIEVLAVADGSIQTVRDVVVGDRPVLLWFFSPH